MLKITICPLMIRSSFYQFYRCLSQTSTKSIRKSFDEKLFENFYQRRFPSTSNIENQLEKFSKTFLHRFNENPTLMKTTLHFDQLIDLLYFTYKNRISFERSIPLLIENVVEPRKISANLFIELVHLLVLHQQKYFHPQTKKPNEILIRFLRQIENQFDDEEILRLSINDLSLLSSMMYRLQMPLMNKQILEHLSTHLIEDEEKKFLSAVDKQNFLKILTLSNSTRMDVAKSLINRFNQSFDEQRENEKNLKSFSYEIVRMMMRIGNYLSNFHYFSSSFFDNCAKLIDDESQSSSSSYRPKDIVQIMNTLIQMGSVRHVPHGYLKLIENYRQSKQFDDKPERLLDVLYPLAMIDACPPNFLDELFRRENLDRLTESRSKEKLFFIGQSMKIFRPQTKFLLDQKFIDEMPNHLFGSWNIEKKKRPYFIKTIDRLIESVPNRHFVRSSFVFRHFKIPDILIRLNEDQQPEIISKLMKNSVRFLEEENRSTSVTYALQILSEDEICLNEHFRPIGLIFSKIRQLKMSNLTPVIIYPRDSLDRCQTSDDVFNWIRNRAETTALLLDR